MKIIVLSLSKYKEKDAIVNAISEESYLAFYAHGILSPTSKNSAINNILTIADATLITSKNNKLSLKESSVISVPFITNSNMEYLTAINLLAEATNKMLDESERHLAFNYLERAINALKDAKYPLLVAISYLAKISKLAGYSLEINRCVRCGSKKDIVTFSFEEGGYVCKNCTMEGDSFDLTKDQLLLIRTLAGSVDFNFNDVSYNSDSAKILLDKFIAFIADIGGAILKSTQLII